ncbi:MAG TPA: type II toxin-antitoxin system prevent-host-death family antitoxin [Chloroflexota bacterium]|nr:type II toxin-antitoxin system prevent-host-death family antitoxin [Chloroflexota bacterium]
MARVDTSDLISITEANKVGLSALVRAAEAGREQVLVRNNKPVAALISLARLDEVQQLEDDLADLALATARLLTDTGERIGLDTILAAYGVTREELAEDLP